MAWFQGPTGTVWLTGRLAELASASGEYELVSPGDVARAQEVRGASVTPEQWAQVTKRPFTLYKVGPANVYLGDIELTGGGGGGGGSGTVTSVNGQSPVAGNVTLNKGHLGLGNVENTSDQNKPVSSAQQQAIDAAQPIGHITGLQAALDAKPPTSRTITAGTGLTGGGNLSANRTISADVAGLDVRDPAKLIASSDPRIVHVADGYTTDNIPAAIASAPASAGIVLIPVAE